MVDRTLGLVVQDRQLEHRRVIPIIRLGPGQPLLHRKAHHGDEALLQGQGIVVPLDLEQRDRVDAWVCVALVGLEPASVRLDGLLEMAGRLGFVA